LSSTSHARRRQVDRFEKRTEKSLEKLRQRNSEIVTGLALDLRPDALAHAINLGLLILYGKPKIGEPLSRAWERVEKKCPTLVEYGLTPFRDRVMARSTGLFFRKGEMFRFPGADEQEQFAAMFAAAPPWLIHFTYADFTAFVLGIKAPDLSSVAKYLRSEKVLLNWPVLPDGAFEFVLQPPLEPLTESERKLVRDALLGLNDQSTPRERRRAFEVYMKGPG
jgi:hypothetical protein